MTGVAGFRSRLASRRRTIGRMSEVTRILSAIEQGDPHAAGQLLPLVYHELRQLAARQLACEMPGQTLQPTALVHEAYLRLVGEQQFEGRGHFLAAAAEAMRRGLIEAARPQQAPQHGGGRGGGEPGEAHPAPDTAPDPPLRPAAPRRPRG